MRIACSRLRRFHLLSLSAQCYCLPSFSSSRRVNDVKPVSSQGRVGLEASVPGSRCAGVVRCSSAHRERHKFPSLKALLIALLSLSLFLLSPAPPPPWLQQPCEMLFFIVVCCKAPRGTCPGTARNFKQKCCLRTCSPWWVLVPRLQLVGGPGDRFARFFFPSTPVSLGIARACAARSSSCSASSPWSPFGSSPRGTSVHARRSLLLAQPVRTSQCARHLGVQRR
mmetsp:Transcript_65262/g.169834  ORF Transcript_65262/g.169834 Transcript_65262/m.169834 type:complete len:225 (+) Transcript_65262:1082-1756(+)